MHIKEITSRSRRDFSAIYVCEHCRSEMKAYGYDDAHFHKNVIPAMVCTECEKCAATPRYKEGEVV